MPEKVALIACHMHEILVEEKGVEKTPRESLLPVEVRNGEAYIHKTILYRQALVLMHLAAKAKTHPKFQSLLIAFERVTFGPGSEPSPEHLAKVFAIRTAGGDLEQLLEPEPKLFRWARQWLLEIGHDEYNPATLLVFGSEWMGRHTLVSKSLKDFEALL